MMSRDINNFIFILSQLFDINIYGLRILLLRENISLILLFVIL